MRLRPITFSDKMVRSIIDGTKTQMRRCVKAKPTFEVGRVDVSPNGYLHLWSKEVYTKATKWWSLDHYEHRKAGDPVEGMGLPCPLGSPGDRIRVQEAWRIAGDDTISRASTSTCLGPDDVQFRATPPNYVLEGEKDMPSVGWRPSTQMLRWASRIMLEITGVRVERLQSISEEDAKAEGVDPALPVADKRWVCAYQRLWASINGAGSWELNPWVWVLDFRPLTSTGGSE